MLDKYNEANLELSLLMFPTREIFISKDNKEVFYMPRQDGWPTIVDDVACNITMAIRYVLEHQIDVTFAEDNEGISVYFAFAPSWRLHSFADHDSKQLTYTYAVCQAVIEKLKLFKS